MAETLLEPAPSDPSADLSDDLPAPLHREIPIRDLGFDGLVELSEAMKLSLSGEDMLEIQLYFNEQRREPTELGR